MTATILLQLLEPGRAVSVRASHGAPRERLTDPQLPETGLPLLLDGHGAAAPLVGWQRGPAWTDRHGALVARFEIFDSNAVRGHLARHGDGASLAWTGLETRSESLDGLTGERVYFRPRLDHVSLTRSPARDDCHVVGALLGGTSPPPRRPVPQQTRHQPTDRRGQAYLAGLARGEVMITAFPMSRAEYRRNNLAAHHPTVARR